MEDSVREAKNHVAILKKEQSRMKFQNNIDRKQQHKVMKEISSPISWMSERTALIGKIKKARSDLEQLKNRDRGVIRAAETVEKRMQDINYSEDDIKAAIICELSTIQTELTIFPIDSIELEKSYNQELTANLKEVLDATALVEEYHKSIVGLLARQDAIAAQGDRLESLKNEIVSLKSQM